MSKELEALENIKRDLEYITRLDYVEPIVRGEVRDNLFKIYHRELPELDIIENALKKYDELSQLKDIEEELGIDPVTLFKALKDGFYAYKGKDIVEIKSKPGNCGAMNFYASYDCIIAEDVFEQKYIYLLKDYGVTWALARKELL